MLLKWIQYDNEKYIVLVMMGFAGPVLALLKFRALPPPAPLPPSVCVSVFLFLSDSDMVQPKVLSKFHHLS